LVSVGSPSIALVVVVRLIVSIPLWLVAKIRLDHIDPRLVGWFRRHFCKWCRGLGVWK